MKNENLSLLPPLFPPPTPPSDDGDTQAWEKHIEAMDDYILEINRVIEEIGKKDFPKAFKEKMAEYGVDIDKPNTMPKTLMESIAEKMNSLLAKLKEFDGVLGFDAGNTSHATTRSAAMSAKRNIKPI